MRPFPPPGAAILTLLPLIAACRAENDPDAGEERLPLRPEALVAETFALVDRSGDSLRIAIEERDGSRLRIARYRTGLAGTDSLVALVDRGTQRPIRSFRRSHDDGGSVTALVEYGRGFDGQARLVLAADDGRRREENLRTPPPVLDAAQVPFSLAALPFDEPTTLHFNFVAPFERRALAARLEIHPDQRLVRAGEGVDAHRVDLRVAGLDERYWFAFDPPHRLLRIEERTRGVVWDRR